MEGRDTRTLMGMAGTVAVTASGPAPGGARLGPATTRTFTVLDAEVDLGTVWLWTATPAVDAGADGAAHGAIRTTFPALPAVVTGEAAYDIRFEDARGQVVWSQTAAPGASLIDARVLEDLAVGVSVTAWKRQGADPRLGTTYRSAQVPVVAGAGAPPSRGRRCTAERTGHGPVAFSPCALTDGDLATPFVPVVGPRCSGGVQLPDPRAPGTPDEPCENDTWVTLDLGDVRPRDLVVVRGSHNRFTVEISADASRWQSVATVSQESGVVAVPLDGRPAARYVRLRPLSGPAVHFQEISVW